jgi:hypothetical protein
VTVVLPSGVRVEEGVDVGTGNGGGMVEEVEEGANAGDEVEMVLVGIGIEGEGNNQEIITGILST